MAGGQYDEALVTLASVEAYYQGQRDREREWLVAIQIARVHERRGSPTEGIAWLERLQVLPHPDMVHAEAEMVVVLASLFLVTGRYTEQLEAAERAASLARQLDDRRLLAGAEVWRGCALNQLGRVDEGRKVQEAAILLADEVGDIATLSHALNDLGFLTEVGGDFAISRHYKQRALQLAERMGDPLSIATMIFRCGQNAFLRGAWSEAEELFLQGIETSQSLGASSISAYPPFGLALLTFARQDIAAARAHAMETLRIAARGDHQAERGALILLAECDLHYGLPEEALRKLDEAGPDGDGLGLYPSGPALVATLLALGRRQEAQRAAEEAVALAEERRHRVALVDALRVRAMATDSDPCKEDLDTALSLARSMGYVYGEMLVLEQRARVMGDSADLARATLLRRQLSLGETATLEPVS
jgi:tetratricopeptide (TPR) repeat protein